MRIIGNGTFVKHKKMKGKDNVFLKWKTFPQSKYVHSYIIIIPGFSFMRKFRKGQKTVPRSQINTWEIMLITNCEFLVTVVTLLEHKWQLSQHLLVTISKKDSCSFVLAWGLAACWWILSFLMSVNNVMSDKWPISFLWIRLIYI